MGKLTVEERHRLGVVERDDPVHRGDRRLVRVEEVGVLDAFGVAEFQALKAEMAHRPPRFALEAQELHRYRDDGDGLRGLFADTWKIGQLAGAIEEPFSRRVQECRQILEDEAGVMVERIPRLGGAADDRDGAFGGVDGFDAAAGIVPLVVEIDDGLGDLGRAGLLEER